MTESGFIELVKAGDAEAVRQALRDEPALADAQEGGVSAVLLAIYTGKADVARAIADAKSELSLFEVAALGDRNRLAGHHGALNEFSPDGFTALGLAAFFGHREVVQDLLRAGADPNVKSRNALGVAPLHSALANQHKEIAADLIRGGAEVNLASAEGLSPLHYTAHYGDIETTRLLLSAGADASARDAGGQTPADEARAKGHSDLAALLEERPTQEISKG
jgi:hypothetical protein